MPQLAIVRSLGGPRRLVNESQVSDFAQELIDQWALALAAAGYVDSYVANQMTYVSEFWQFLAKPLWMADVDDADRFLTWLRRGKRHAGSTVRDKALTLARFYDFLRLRYQGDIYALTGVDVAQPIDEYNRPARTDVGKVRIPPATSDVEGLFDAWRASLPQARKYLPAARDYFAASLWRRVGLRINETSMLDLRDWRPDFGEHGKLHVRFGKGSQGRGPKTRLVPGINQVDELLNWWLVDVRHQFGDDWQDPNAPLLPSERRDPATGRCRRVGTDALRTGLSAAVARWLPAWDKRLTPHTLRHYCASSLYEQGIGLKAIQELLGHSWLSTTTLYVHVHNEQIERSWDQSNQRIAARLIGG